MSSEKAKLDRRLGTHKTRRLGDNGSPKRLAFSLLFLQDF